MTKVGLKETLSLLAAGYKKKDIEAMIAAEEEAEKETEKETPAAPASAVPESAPEDAAAKESTPEPDLKKELETKQKELEEIQKKLKENEDQLKEKDEKIKKIQKDNVNSNSLSDVEKERAASQASLIDAIKSFY